MLPQRKPTRLAGFDYSSDRLYFITCCVKHMRHCFGQVVDGRMRLNDYGVIADTQWLWLAEQYPYVRLHAHIIMPNHMHGIIEIDSRGAGSAEMKIKSLSELMGAYKTTSSKKIHLAGDPNFAWHRSFYDHIIRDAQGYHNISAYVENNPAKWEADRFFQR